MTGKAKYRNCASLFALVAGVASFAQTAHAQIETVTVTAERRTENLQTTAISATVLTAEDLQAKGVTGLTALQYAAPGVQIADYGSANTFNIRGVGQARVDVDLPSGVVIYRDGVPTLTGYFQNVPYYDMASVEVLRGPQGTFAGKAAAAGAVFMRTASPTLDSFNGNLMVGAGNRGFFETTGVANLPVGDTFALRLASHYETRDSLFDSITSNPLPGGAGSGGAFKGSDHRDLRSVRLGTLWQPTENFTATFKIDYDNLHFGSHATTGFNPLTGLPEDIRNPIVNGVHGYVDKGTRASLNLDYNTGLGVSIKSLTGFSTVDTTADWDINGSDPAPFGFFSHGIFTNWSQEIDILSDTDQPFRWVVGGFWQSYLNTIPDATPGVSTFNGQKGFGFDYGIPAGNIPGMDYYTPWRKKELSLSWFGQAEYDITDALTAQAGIRFNHYSFNQFTHFVFPPFDLEPGGHTDHYQENQTDWKLNLNYKLDDVNFLYALVSRGHSPGSRNLACIDAVCNAFGVTVPDPHAAYKPMGVINYEAGWKSTIFDGHMNIQLDGYYQVFKNYQADFGLAPGPGVPASLSLSQFQNAKTDSTIWGIEFGGQAQFGDLAIDMGAAYSRSKLGDFGTVINPFDPIYGGGATIDMDGASTPFAPKFTGNIGAAYTFHLGNGFGEEDLTMTPRLDLAYRGMSYARLFKNPSTELPSVTLLNGNIMFTNGPWGLEFWGTNLLDEKYIAAKQNVDVGTYTGVVGPVITGIVYGGQRRLVGVRLSRSF
jgi:iron complex outermembrane receptor protein